MTFRWTGHTVALCNYTVTAQ